MNRTCILLAKGFEEIEALTVVDVLRRLDIECIMCSIDSLEVTGAHRITIVADRLMNEMNFKDYGAVILPGGMPGAANLKADRRVISLIREFDKAGKLIAAICAAPIVLKEAGIIKGRTITSFPGIREELKDSHYGEDSIVQDKNILTSRGPGTAFKFAFKIAENMLDINTVNQVKRSMMVE